MKFLDEVISIDKEAKRLKAEGVNIIIALGYCNTGCVVLKRGTKSERLLHQNQHIPGKLLNFEFWINGELSKSAKI